MISRDPISGGLYEVQYFTNDSSFEYVAYEFKIDGDFCTNKIHYSDFIKLECFKDVKYLLVIIHDRRGFIFKWMMIDTIVDSIEYQPSCESSDLSQIDIIFKIKQIETYTVDDYELTPGDLIKQIKRKIHIEKRDLKISTIIE